MAIDIFGEKTIPMTFEGFDLEMATKIAKKFKFQATDYELLKRHLNLCYYMYINGTWVFKNLKRPAELKNYSKQFIFHCKKLIALINEAEFHISFFLQAPTQTQKKELSLQNLVNDLELFLSRAEQYLPKQCRDKGGVKEKDRAFSELIKQLIYEYQLHSKLKPKIGWNDEHEEYQGAVYDFIHEYLNTTKIPVPINDLGKYISRIISGKKTKTAPKSK
jgi:hypothetical protein